MKLSVKARIALVMIVVVTLNVVAGVVSWTLYRSAANSGERARAAVERARLATAASESVTEFMAGAKDLALSVETSTTSAERSRSYGDLIGVDPVADRAIAKVAAATPGEAGTAAQDAWQLLRTSVFAWINTEAESSGAELRITRNPNGAYRNSISSNLSLPPDLSAMPPAGLRQAIRDRAERFKYATLGDIVKTAAAESAAATAAESRARLRAQQGTVALVGLSALVATILGIGLYRSISRPLSAARIYADRVASGDYDAPAPSHSADEIGVLTHAVENMKDNLVHEMNVMREMAGAVMFTAEGVKAAVSSTSALVDTPEGDSERVKAGLSDVGDQVDALHTLSCEMLGL